MTTFEGTCAIVTGAGSGIGQECAIRLARHGADVAVLDRDLGAAQSTADAIVTADGAAAAFGVDVTDEHDVEQAIARATGLFGTPRTLINCAGIAVRKGLLGTSVAEWRRVLDVNLTGYFIVLQAVARRMVESGGGAVIQIASIAGHIGYGSPSYTATKGGVLAMTRQLADELAPHRIRINSISPGVVQTGLNRDTLTDDAIRASTLANIPVGRLGQPSDIAAAAVFLAGPEANFITGTDLVVDGGMISGIHWGEARDKVTHFHENR